MAIQVQSTVHAAVTVYALSEGEQQVFYQSPQGCVMQRSRPNEESNESAWVFLLDQPLDVGSTGFTATAFQAIEPQTPSAQAVVPVLFHIDDSVKALAFATYGENGWALTTQSFHALFMNFQANQSEFYPIDNIKFPLPS